MKKENSKQKQNTQSNLSEIQHQNLDFRGITLIALIITIIVMLILVAVTVSVAVNSGLFKHAETASEGWKQAQEIEQDIGSGNVQIATGDTTYNSVNEYLENNPVTKLKVGDYIDYKPESAEDYSLLSTVSGYTDNSNTAIDQNIPQENLKWRVLSINDDGTVELVSAIPTTTSVALKGAIRI